MINLDDQIERQKLILQIHKDVDDYCIETFTEGPRTHLGASIIGDECQAYSWNTFRWLLQEKLTGQKFRLFNRGHKEEARFIQWLEGAGFQLWEHDPDTGKQYRISGVKGHFGGSLDSIVLPPERYGLGPLYWLGEFKTHNEKSFAKLAGPKPSWQNLGKRPRSGGEGVKISKPVHYKQMASYGRAYGFEWGFYCAVNKETDELYFELVKLNFADADDLFRKAEVIVNSQVQPPKIAQTETFFKCKNLCQFVAICHRGELPTKNCRSCVSASPIDHGQWFCSTWNNQIPTDFVLKGCDSWKAIING